MKPTDQVRIPATIINITFTLIVFGKAGIKLFLDFNSSLAMSTFTGAMIVIVKVIITVFPGL